MLEWRWFSEPNVLSVFIFLLLHANHKEVNWRGIEIKAGQCITSVESISKKTKLSAQKVRTVLKKLQKSGEIFVKSTNKFTFVTIENWHIYQREDAEANNQITNEQQSNNNQLTTNKNEKNVEKEKKERIKNTMPGKPDCVGNNLDITKEIIEHLNTRLGTQYKPTTKGTIKLINARINEGHSLNDFFDVVDKKTMEWRHRPDMATSP